MKKDKSFTLDLLKNALLILGVTIFFIIPANTILANPLSLINVPLDSWVYPAISRLETLQAFNGNDSIALNTIPLSRIKIAFLIDTALSNIQEGKVKLKQTDLLLMDKLVKEFHAELSALDLDSLNPESIFEIEPYFIQKADLLKQSKNIEYFQKINLFSELGVKFSTNISQNSGFYLDALACTDYDWASSDIQEGKIPFRAQIKQVYINFNLSSFEIAISDNVSFLPDSIGISDFSLVVGRDLMRWGPGYQGSLVLSDNPPAFDMFKYSGVIDLNDSGESMAKINFTKFFSLLDTLDEQNRYFSGQRLEYKPFDALTLGLSETAVISYDSSLLFINPIPFIPPYYITRWIADQINQPSEINSNVGIDIELNFSPGIKLYGEWMADDFILTPKTNPYPNRTGFLTGVYFADPLGGGNTDFRIEYTHINNYVYFPTHPWQDYLYQGEFIGHSLGPDADQLYLGLTHQLSDSLNLSLSYTHERHGEGQVGIPLPPDPVVANENIFLSGIIEKQQAYQVEISYTISPQWELSAGITRENIKNKDNNTGANENNTYFQIELEYQF